MSSIRSFSFRPTGCSRLCDVFRVQYWDDRGPLLSILFIEERFSSVAIHIEPKHGMVRYSRCKGKVQYSGTGKLIFQEAVDPKQSLHPDMIFYENKLLEIRWYRTNWVGCFFSHSSSYLCLSLPHYAFSTQCT